MADKGRPSDMKKLKEENRRLRTAVEELKILNEIATAIGSVSSLEDVMSLIVQKCIKHLRVEQAAVVLIEPGDKDSPFKTVVRRADKSKYVLPYRLDDQLRGYMLKNQKPLLVNDLAGDTRFSRTLEKGHIIRSVLSVPLLRKGKMIGILNAFNKKTPGGFSEADQRLLFIIASQSAQVLENARLAEEERKLAIVREDMRLAHDIQMDLLPDAAPSIPGYEIAGTSVPAKEVGGDYYDFIQVGTGRLAVCLGDVSGKGIPAALLMANLQATMRSQASQDLTPAECLKRSNNLLFRSTDAGSFATLFLGVLNADQDSLSYSNAGHNPPFIIKAGGDLVRLHLAGLILGCLEDANYQESIVEVDPGDLLFIYSDGLTEAVNEEEKEFGEAGLTALLTENREMAPRSLIEKVIGTIRGHMGSASQSDDMTAIAVRKL